MFSIKVFAVAAGNVIDADLAYSALVELIRHHVFLELRWFGLVVFLSFLRCGQSIVTTCEFCFFINDYRWLHLILQVTIPLGRHFKRCRARVIELGSGLIAILQQGWRGLEVYTLSLEFF